MICPYCDSLLKTVPENGCCPNCNAPLGASFREEENAFPAPSLGVYEGISGDSLEIKEKSVIIRKEKTESGYELRYEELKSVLFKPAENAHGGYLSIRSSINEQMPFPANSWDAVRDVTTTVFTAAGNMVFWKVCEFLQECVAVAKRMPKKEKLAFAKAPIGVYKGVGGQMELTADSVIITRTMPLLPQTRYAFAYDDLFDVYLGLPSLGVRGDLQVRGWQNRRMKFGITMGSETLFFFTQKHLEEIQIVYEFLKECCKKPTEE